MIPQQIVIIDDDYKSAELLVYRLMREGYQVRAEFSIPANLQAVLTLGVPAAIIMELNFQLGDGFDLLRELRAEPLLQQTKIIALSNPRSIREEGRARHLGADEYMLKPFSPRAVLERLRDLLSARQSPGSQL